MNSKRTRRTRRKGAQPNPPPLPEPEDACRALLGVVEKRGRSDKNYEASVEDPLGDWPEDSGEPDQWLLERRHQDKERQSH